MDLFSSYHNVNFGCSADDIGDSDSFLDHLTTLFQLQKIK
jgi:hypothetical protein